ncbi:MAG: VWA domain-containing protein [Coriobacteriia bacterium]|nr:VWA domain-containing protein [Coriobacteriia bacterium]
MDPRVGGVLVRGEKGTAKSTAVRALAAVLPEMDVVEGCRFSCDPADPGAWCPECRERRDSSRDPLPKLQRRPYVVDLPVSATEDRLVGTLNLEHALKHGERIFEPGILAEANRSILYVDEVNLLDDHLVDTLLDSAAMGVNVVQREGIAYTHPARFILVGTMNPEEGDVRPQLLDRFGLCVEVEGVREPSSRVDIVKRRHAFEEDPSAFARTWIDSEDELRVKLKHARLRLPTVVVSDEILFSIATLCSQMGVDGHRADLVMARAAAAYAAFAGRACVEIDDVRIVAPLVLAHRMRKTPFHDETFDEQRVSSALDTIGSDSGQSRSDPGDSADGSGAGALAASVMSANGISEEIDLFGSSADLLRPLDEARRSMSGRRHETISTDGRGRYTRSEPARAGSTDVALDATIRAAAPLQAMRTGDMAINIAKEDVHTKVRKRKVGASIVLCVDASGSMGAADRMDAARGAILELLVDAYQRRDRVGLVSFRGDDAEIALAPTASVELAQLKLKSLPTGGATPLAHGLVRSLELLEGEMRRNSDTIPWLILVTDGRANVGLNGGLGSEDARAVAARVRAAKVHVLVIDTGSGPRSVSGARDIAKAADGEYVRLASIDPSTMAKAVRERLKR